MKIDYANKRALCAGQARMPSIVFSLDPAVVLICLAAVFLVLSAPGGHTVAGCLFNR